MIKNTNILGAITGSIAAAYYGVPDYIAEYVYSYLPAEMRSVLDKFDSIIDR